MKVLVADDNPMWLTLIASNVRQWKLEPVQAKDGVQAIAKLEEDESIRIAILDWQMPGIDGLEVCRRVKHQPQRPFTYVIMLTGRDSKADVIRGLEAGVDEYLTKPVEMDELRIRVKAARRVIEAIPPTDWTRPRIPGYTIDSILGRGAFATVWRGSRNRDRLPVAIKVLRVDLATENVLRRFGHEIDVLKRLDHPSITRIHDGRIDTDVGYFVMDLNEGGTLGEYQARESPSGRACVGLIRQVSEGIQHAHSKGIIHRDLKFANVMMDMAGTPRIVD
ncbi:MAG: response regulator, partial [Planctomycetota bacterium]